MFKSKLLKVTALLMAAICIVSMFAACTKSDSGNEGGSGGKAYDYDLTPYIKLGTYKGVVIGPYDPLTVEDYELQNEIDYIIQYYTTTESVLEGVLELGDTANINYIGRIDGVEFEGGSAEAYDLELGSGAFIPGFEDGIVGHEVGETFTINVTFPEEYGHADLAGKETEFEITINSKTVYNVPVYNDEFIAANMDGYSTTAELEESIRQELIAEKELDFIYTKEADAWNAAVANAEITELPQVEVDRYIEEIRQYHTEEAQYYGYTLDEYIEAVGMTMDDFNQYLLESAEATVYDELVMFAIIEAENLVITDEEYAPLLQVYVDTYGYTDIAELEELYGKDILIQNLLWDKVNDLVYANAVEAG